MKKKWNKVTAALLMLVMVVTTVLGAAPALSVKAEPVTMGHLKSGSGNANGHFGSATPEAFVLSEKADYTNQAYSLKLRINSDVDKTRLRIVTKYKDDNNWAFLMYDVGSWKWQYKKDGNEAWQNDTLALPRLEKGQLAEIKLSYKDNGLEIDVNGTKATVTEANFVALKDVQGKVGVGGATFGDAYTDVYFNDVVVGETKEDLNTWKLYKDNLAGQEWDPAAQYEETVPAGRKWITIRTGSQNGGGHSYAGATGPALLLDKDRTIKPADVFSLSFTPINSGNFGFFYSYVNDNDFLYIGYDSSSKWYWQNGSGSYGSLNGDFETPENGKEMTFSVTMSREALTVTVNGISGTTNNQNAGNWLETNAGKGHPGVMVKTANQSLKFADAKVNETACMEDTWEFAKDRDGQSQSSEYINLATVSGTVTAKDGGAALKGATVRFGSKSAKTDDNGAYQIEDVEVGTYTAAASCPGYEAITQEVEVQDAAEGENVFNFTLSEKTPIDLKNYKSIESDYMKVYVGPNFPVVARYEVKGKDDVYFRGNESDLAKVNTVVINGKEITPEVKAKIEGAKASYEMTLKYEGEDEETKININMNMTVEISVKDNDLTWEITKIDRKEGTDKIASIDIPQLNLLSVDQVEENASFAGAVKSTDTKKSGDKFITFDDGFVAQKSVGYVYGFLTNKNLSAGLFSNSEAEDDLRVIMNSGADTMSLTSAQWYYEAGDKGGQAQAATYDYPLSELPYAKVCIAEDMNEDKTIDWQDAAVAYRDIINVPYGSEDVKDLVNYRIVMNFGSAVTNPYSVTADNIKKVALATDGLPQAVMLKGYGNEGHDSANSEYADISEREGGVDDFRDLLDVAHEYDTEIGIHVNAQEAYPEARSFNDDMIMGPQQGGWGWLDQSRVINKIWDLGTQARYKRFAQLFDRINNTNLLSLDWDKGEYVKDSQGTLASADEIAAAVKKAGADNMDFIYLDVWYQNAWETRRIAEEINSLGWRFSTEFPYEGEYDSTWSHWATEGPYGGSATKGLNSDIIRFLRNDMRDVQVLNWVGHGGAADNPLLGGYKLEGFEGWGGDQDFNNYLYLTFAENLPTKFLQHYQVIDWENYAEGESPVGNQEKQITLKNGDDKVVVTRNEAQRSDEIIEREITLNDKTVLSATNDHFYYLLPWTDSDTKETKLYHYNLEGGTSTWNVPDGFTGNLTMYELSDQGRGEAIAVPVSNGQITLEAKAKTAYVIVTDGKEMPTADTVNFGETTSVKDPGFNSYADGDKVDADVWSGADNDAVKVTKAWTGDQRLTIESPAEDVAVSTKLTGLKAGKDYVAEVYVDNRSDSKATVEVNAGTIKESAYTTKSIAQNYVASDQKHAGGNEASYMQRVYVPFTAEKETATLTISRAAGDGATYFDDIRIIDKKIENYKEDGSFEQDFESVTSGYYPFVLGPAQRGGDGQLHLSQDNGKYTSVGWGGYVINDVIEGEWSLKQHCDSGSGSGRTGLLYHTIPQNFRFEAGKTYKVEFDYEAGSSAYAVVLGDGESFNNATDNDYLAATAGTGKASHHEFTVTGSESGQTWFGIYANGAKQPGGAYGQQDLILDNLKITPVKSGEVDTTKLEAELNNADKVVLDAFEDGKEKAAFEAAYAAAQKVLENPTDQAAVDKAEKDLEDARKALLATSPKPEEDKEAPTKPSDLKETETTTTTVKVEWKASTDNVEVTGYNVYADGKLAETVKGDVLTAELKDLKAGTEYTIEVEAFDAAGNKSEKASVKATTKEEQKPDPKPEEDKEAPTKPSDLKVTDKTDTTVKIEWKASKDNVGVTGYEIFVNGKSIGTVKDDVLTAEIAKLTPKTEYPIEVVAYDAAGNKSAAASVKATTKEGKTPETPTTPEVKPGTVQTGDATPFAVPFMMMFIAVAMFAGVSVIRVKKRK